MSSSASEECVQDDLEVEHASGQGSSSGSGSPNKIPKKQQQQQHKGNVRLSTAFCRLCHGKYSQRRLRHVFGKQPEEEPMVVDNSLGQEKSQGPLLFSTDFQLLLGVPITRNPQLSSFICKTCHAQFYKCHRILADFRKRVNHTPINHEGHKDRVSEILPNQDDSLSNTSITSDSRRLHDLVSWAHHHGTTCHSCPNLKEVLEDQCRGSPMTIWGCIDGHNFVMDASGSQSTQVPAPKSGGVEGQSSKDGRHNLRTPRKPSNTTAGSSTTQPSPTNTPNSLNCNQSDISSPSTDGLFPSEELSPPNQVQPMEHTAESDLSDRNLSSEEEPEGRGKSASCDEQAPSNSLKRSVPIKKKCKQIKPPTQPKERKKPGPKKKPKSEREELPNIYKCPYQGCTAVYRGSDGMKKHIKEHHEEVRERPCPHPGCNKVFMIDRYLQRHVKLIHTEERNYICDTCGTTFKQRKHLSVHQMRHSGAKPLQCEICGFQCRQRASLKYHMTKHKAEADLEFACALCGKRFEKAHNLNVHMSMVHPLMQGGSNSNDPPSSGQQSNQERFRNQQTRTTETQPAPMQPPQAFSGPSPQENPRISLTSPEVL